MLISYKLPGIVSCSSDTETFPPCSERKSCAGPDRQHSSGLSMSTDSRGCDQLVKQRNIPSPF